MDENEARSVGMRAPRGYVRYPYTNQHGAQGYTKYTPVKDLYERLYEETLSLIVPQARVEVLEINERLIQYLAQHPERLQEIDPRKFEEIVADIFQDRGFEVALTPRTRDGGRDINAVYKSSLGSFLYLVECKRYRSSNKVGVEIVRALYGVKQRERATMGVLA
jgi:HJR/Mrr/RecB family endonuclease